jgi:ABC-type tungstate transport system substrate-binding protein
MSVRWFERDSCREYEIHSTCLRLSCVAAAFCRITATRRESRGFSLYAHRALICWGKDMRFKVFAAVLAAVALMSAAVGVASATNGPIHETTAQTTTAIQTTATKLEPATGLVGDDQGTCAL